MVKGIYLYIKAFSDFKLKCQTIVPFLRSRQVLFVAAVLSNSIAFQLKYQ